MVQLLPQQAVPLEEQLEALGDAVREGKVRYIGLSNETPWGLSKCLHLGECHHQSALLGHRVIRRGSSPALPAVGSGKITTATSMLGSCRVQATENISFRLMTWQRRCRRRSLELYRFRMLTGARRGATCVLATASLFGFTSAALPLRYLCKPHHKPVRNHGRIFQKLRSGEA